MMAQKFQAPNIWRGSYEDAKTINKNNACTYPRKHYIIALSNQQQQQEAENIMIMTMSIARTLNPSDATTGLHVRETYIPKAQQDIERTKAMIAQYPQAAKDLEVILTEEEAILSCLTSRFS